MQRQFSVARQRINHFLLFKRIQRIEGSMSPSSAFMWYPGSDCIWGRDGQGCGSVPSTASACTKGLLPALANLLDLWSLWSYACVCPLAWLSEIEVVSSLCADDDFFFLPVVAPIFWAPFQLCEKLLLFVFNLLRRCFFGWSLNLVNWERVSTPSPLWSPRSVIVWPYSKQSHTGFLLSSDSPVNGSTLSSLHWCVSLQTDIRYIVKILSERLWIRREMV